MLLNIDQALYVRFKKYRPEGGYRKKEYENKPVLSISEIVQLGYLDVNRTLGGIDPEQSRQFKDVVGSFISDLLASPSENQEVFDILHRQCCEECLGSTGNAHIHYGQAQKLLNMSLKYLYNEYAVYRGKTNQFRFPDNNIEHFFHLPIDSQIRDFLVRNCHFIAPTRIPWSQWNYEHYISFQRQLRQRNNPKFCPLEIDYMLWNTEGASVGDAIAAK
jgi:hypothetical protein